MTPIRFVFLTLMFGVIIPSPTQGKIKMTFREATSMSSSDLEKRQAPVGPENAGEYGAFLTFMNCSRYFGLGTGAPCNEGYATIRAAEVDRKYKDVDLQDVPLDAWVRKASLNCLPKLVCSITPDRLETKVCACPPSPGPSDPECGPDPIVRDPRVNCDKEYKAYHKFRPNRGVSISKSGWCLTVVVATAICGRQLFSP